jgi:hypothetical protein
LNNLKGEKVKDYKELLKILYEVLNGRRLIDATPEDYQAINTRLFRNPRLGQFLPSLYTLLREKIVDLDQVTKIEKQLHAKNFPGIPHSVTELMPQHMINPNQQDSHSCLLVEIDDEYIKERAKPPRRQPVFHVDTSGLPQSYTPDQDDLRLREPDRQQKNKLQLLCEQHRGLWYFNLANVTLEQSPELTAMARERLRQPDVYWILNAYTEAGTINDALAHLLNLVLPGNIVVVSPDITTLQTAAPYCRHVINQNDVWKNVNWTTMIEAGFLPNDRDVFENFRGKGATVMAAIFYLMAREVPVNDILLGHSDTDITNHDRDGTFYKFHHEATIDPYRPAEYIILPFVLAPASVDIISSQPGKNDPPRQGAAKLPGNTRLMNGPDKFIRSFGEDVASAVWGSPGERITRGVHPLAPWTPSTGFDMGEFFAAYYKALVGDFGPHHRFDCSTLPDTRLAVAQIAVPPPKKEGGGVDQAVDIAEGVWSGMLTHDIADFYRDLQRDHNRGYSDLLPEIPFGFGADPRYYGLWNTEHAGVGIKISTGPYPEWTTDKDGLIHYTQKALFEEANQPNTVIWRKGPSPILPSPQTMVDLGFVDMEGISNILNYSLVR